MGYIGAGLKDTPHGVNCVRGLRFRVSQKKPFEGLQFRVRSNTLGWGNLQ